MVERGATPELHAARAALASWQSWSETGGDPLPAPGPGLIEALERGRLIKDERETLLVRAPLAGGRGHVWWKLYRVPPGKRWLAGWARSRAGREWRALRALADRGLPVPRALAWAERRTLGGLHASLLLTGEVPGARDLRHWTAPGELSGALRWRLLEAAGGTARRLHDAGFGHFRMQPRNLLARKGDGDSWRLWWLDLPYACQWREAAPQAVRAVDLVDLAGSRSSLDTEDARAVLAGYAAGRPPPLDLGALRGRSPWAQKLRRIGCYLLAVNTGHRPGAP